MEAMSGLYFYQTDNSIIGHFHLYFLFLFTGSWHMLQLGLFSVGLIGQYLLLLKHRSQSNNCSGCKACVDLHVPHHSNVCRSMNAWKTLSLNRFTKRGSSYCRCMTEENDLYWSSSRNCGFEPRIPPFGYLTQNLAVKVQAIINGKHCQHRLFQVLLSAEVAM